MLNHRALLALFLAVCLVPTFASAQAVGILDTVEFEGNTLLLVHAEDDQYADDPYQLETGGSISVVDVEPALLAGASPAYHLLVDRSFFCREPSTCTVDALEPLAVAIEQTFNPGESIVIASIADPAHTAAPILEMDAIRPAVNQLWDSLGAPTPDTINLDEYAATLSPEQHHVVMLLSAGPAASPIILPAPAPILTVHRIFTGVPPTQCPQIVEEGGMCIEANDPVELTTMLAVDRLETLFSVRLGCPEFVPSRGQDSVLISGANGRTYRIPLASLVCTIEASEAISPVFLYGGAAGTGLVILLLIIFIARRPRQNEAPPVDFSSFSPNTTAHVLSSIEPVTERPDWLRRPELDDMRQAMRHMPMTGASDVILLVDRTSGPATYPLQSSQTILVGASEDALLRITNGPANALLLETDAFGKPRVARIGDGIDVRLNGGVLTGGSSLSPGDELTIGDDIILEIRSPGTACTRLVPQTDDAFDTIAPGATSIVLGRDPLPYVGVRPIPAKLAIANISSDHVEIWQSGGRAFVRDLGSSNGTWVRRERVQANRVVPINPGDTVELASLVRFTVE
jgi:hypothetical protein